MLLKRRGPCRQWRYASGGQPNINLSLLLPYPIPLPPESEQERIKEELDRRFSSVETLAPQLIKEQRRSDRLRQSILESAFAGQLVPHDPTDEPASALLERIRAERVGSGAKPSIRRSRKELAHA